MRNIAPALVVLAAFAVPLPTSALTAASSEDCVADIAAIDAAAAQISVVAPVPASAWILDMLPADKRPAFEDGFCVIRDIRTTSMGANMMSQQFFASAVRWQADWADASRPMPPNRLVLEVPKFGIIYGSSADPADKFRQMMAYHSGIMADLYPNEFRLEMTFDPQTDQLEIRQLAVQNAYANRAEFSATLRDADLDGAFKADWSAAAPLEKLEPLSIHAAELSVTNNGYFDVMAMSWLNLIYPRLGDTPKAAVAAAQGIARDQIAQAPDTVFPPDSKAALIAVVDSVPHPSGTLRLRLDAPNGIQPARMAAAPMMAVNNGWTTVEDLLAGASLNAEWKPTERPLRLLPPLSTE